MGSSLVSMLRKKSLIILIVILIAGVISNTLLSEVVTWENRDLSIFPVTQVTTPEGLVTYEINVQGMTDPIEGEYVTLSATTSHPSITYTIAPNNRVAPFTCTMTVDVSASTPPGTYSITVVATSTWDQTYTTSETVQLTVMELMTATVIPPPPSEETTAPQELPPPSEETTAPQEPPPSDEQTNEPEEVPSPTITPFDFKIKLRPSTVETSGGEPAQYQVIIEYSDPIWNEVPINLQVETPFEWMQCDLSPTHKITITAPSNTEPGTYGFTVIGAAQELEHVKEGTITIIGEPKEPQEQPSSRESTSEKDLLLENMKEQIRSNVEDEKVAEQLIDNFNKLKSLMQDEEQEQAEEKKKAQQDAAFLQMIIALISFVVGSVAGVIGSFLKGKGRTSSKQSKQKDGYCPCCGKPLEP